MRAAIKKTCTVVCGPGSVVEITRDQFLALGDAAVAVPEKKPAKTSEKKGKK